MIQILAGSLLLSLLHAIIPNHWLPVIAIGKKEGWTLTEVTNTTFYAALAHATSTILLGILISFLGAEMAEHIEEFTHFVAPLILILLGLIFIYRHHRHRHFHIQENFSKKRSKRQIIIVLVFAMFLSPCMEIEAYFLLAGTYSKSLIGLISLLYAVITITGMVALVRYAYQGLLKINQHLLEHNAGIITGITLVITGVISLYIH